MQSSEISPTAESAQDVGPVADDTQISAAWLAAALGRDVTAVTAVTRIGNGYMSRTYRVTFTTNDDGATSVIAKLPASDPNSRHTALRDDVYFREVNFYRAIAPLCGSALPHCFFSAYDGSTNDFTLLLEDVEGAIVIDQLDGCDLATAHRVVATIAAVQGPLLDSDVIFQTDSLNRPSPFSQTLVQSLLPRFRARFADHLTPEIDRVVDALAASLDAWAAFLDGPRGLQHGDCRLDNMLLSPSRCVLVDWQTVLSGSPLADLSFFLGGSLTVELRRRHEKELVDAYAAALSDASGLEISLEWCHEEYRRRAFLGVLQSVMAIASVEQTERGDLLFRTMLTRHSTHVLDSNALDLLPVG
jgi:hypothetical protein